MEIVVLLTIALVLRLINLNQSLWLDEAVQAITAKESFGYIFQEIVGDFHPPLYHFLMHFWVRVFGSSEIALRIPSVIFGVLTVWVVYKIAQELSVISGQGSVGGKIPTTVNRSLAAIAALFMATAPFHIYYSQEARMYSMTCFFASLSMYYFLKVIGDRVSATSEKPITSSRLLMAEYLISSALLIYSDYYGFLIVLSQGIYLLIKRKYKYLILNTFFLILIFVPWLPMFLKQVNAGITATHILPEWGELVNLSFFKALPLTFVKFSLGRITIFDKRLYFAISSLLVGIYGFFIIGGFSYQLSVIRDRYLAIEKKRQITGNWSLIAIWTWFFVPLILAWGASLFVPNYQPFRLLLIIPAFYLLLAFGISSFKNKTVQIALFSFVVITNLLSASFYYFNPFFQREDWKGVADYVIRKNALAVLPSETSFWPLRYYDSQNKIEIAFGSRGIEKVGSKPLNIASSEKVFYIRYLVPLFDPHEKILKHLEELNYSKIKETSFNQIPVWEYQRSNQ